jgi:mannose-6-phosphate isomerase-like protein (cupin superfamily)
MRIQIFAVTFLAVTTSSALAQKAAAPATAFMSDKDILALVDKAKADRKGDAAVTLEPILLMAPYRAMLEYRPIGAGAAVHTEDAELMVVLQGAGDIITGGTLVDGKQVNAYNMSGPSISGGQDYNVVKGDMILIPPNTPHQVTPSGGAPIVLMTMHVPYPPNDWKRAQQK